MLTNQVWILEYQIDVEISNPSSCQSIVCKAMEAERTPDLRLRLYRLFSAQPSEAQVLHHKVLCVTGSSL